MSRTYRKRSARYWSDSDFTFDYEYGEWYTVSNGWKRRSVMKTRKRRKTRKEIAMEQRDGQWGAPYEHYWFNYANRVRRRVEREQLQKAYTCDDFDYYDFDDTRAVRWWKGIWWTIY